MLANPKPGQRVQVWYATKPKRAGGLVPAEVFPLHGKLGTVKHVAKGPGPRNHGVLIDGGRVYAIPCGNLRQAE